MAGRARRLLLGTPVVYTRTGHLVVKIADPNTRYRIGWRVIDSAGRELGLLTDIIGNVEEPYAVVRPSIENPEKLVGEGIKVFVLIPLKQKRRRRGKSGRRRGEGKASRAKRESKNRGYKYNSSSSRRGRIASRKKREESSRKGRERKRL